MNTVTEQLKLPPSFRLKVVIHEAEEGGYWAEVPAFPGCVSEGETLDQVRAENRGSVPGRVRGYAGRARPVPAECAMKHVTGKEMCRALERNGWTLSRIRGSHHIYTRPGAADPGSRPPQ